MSKNKKQSLLWKISGKKIDTSYLFGTMHVRDERAFRGIDFVQNRLLDCAIFAAEYDLGEGDNLRLQQAAQLPAGITLRKLLKERRYTKLSKVLQRQLEINLEMFNYSSPVLLLNIVSGLLLGQQNKQPLDAALYEFAEVHEKRLTGLESFEGQMAVLGQLELKEQVKSLKQLANNFGKYRQELKSTTNLYVQGDIYQLLKKVKNTAGGMRNVLLYDRNIRMTNKMLEIAEKGSLFAAVGAGHLAGKKGMLRMLKKQGCTIKPIFY